MIAILALAFAHLGQTDASFIPSGPTIRFILKKGGEFDIATAPETSPKTVAHIIALTKKGFYDRQRIHRVESWVVQWGAPASRDKPLNSDAVGDGGSGTQLPFEMSDVDFTRGVVGIASDGLQMGGDSQLFIIKTDRLYLYHSYAVVGKVSRGMKVVDKIEKGDRIKEARVIGRSG